MNPKAMWIWDALHDKQNDWVMFRRTFTAEVVKECMLEISADTRYFLWLNKKNVVWDGGLFRDAYCENSGFIDCLNITKQLVEGENLLEILVWHYGNGGRNNNPLKTAGLIFSCEAINLYSDTTTLCQRHPSFKETGAPLPSYLFGGDNIRYDANFELQDSGYKSAVAIKSELFGTMYERPVPLFPLSEVMTGDYDLVDGKYCLKLPTALHVMPYLEVVAQGGELIDIRHDRYNVPGGPGDDGNLYQGHRTEYICAPGENKFMGFDYMPCETLEFTIPDTVKILALGYAVSEYPTEIAQVFECEDKSVNRLIEKCARTLKFCMRDNFMDCPDRERGQWIGDVSVQAPQVFYALDDNATQLLKKAIYNFIFLRKGDVLVGNVPGIHFQELPSQSLNAISKLGMIAQYYEFTGDKATLADCFYPMVNYLKLWDMGDDGMVVRRQGDWCWFDHLNNQDAPILENTWYYSALQFCLETCSVLDDAKHYDFLNERMHSIKNNFEQLFWKGKYYSSGTLIDDRANAMAVLVGLAKQTHYRDIRKVLVSTYNASTYMEGYVCEALFVMGYYEDGFKRIMSRYHPLIKNENSTLWEDFMILGTKNHAWTGAPLTLFYRYFAGVSIDCNKKIITLSPNFSVLKQQKYSMNIANGAIDVNLKQLDGTVVGQVINTTGYKLIKNY